MLYVTFAYSMPHTAYRMPRLWNLSLPPHRYWHRLLIDLAKHFSKVMEIPAFHISTIELNLN